MPSSHRIDPYVHPADAANGNLSDVWKQLEDVSMFGDQYIRSRDSTVVLAYRQIARSKFRRFTGPPFALVRTRSLGQIF